MQETQGMRIPSPSLGWEDPLEKGMATHSSIFAWRLPMDRGAWRVIVQWVVKSRTRLNDQVWISRVNRVFKICSFRKSVGRVVVEETGYWPVFSSGNLRWQLSQLLFSCFSFFLFLWKLVGEYSGECCPTPAPDKLKCCRLVLNSKSLRLCLLFHVYMSQRNLSIWWPDSGLV